jgi:hypothetical protein
MTDNIKIRPQDKWNEKNKYISKSFRMYQKTADEFKEACERAGVSQSGQIVKMMQEFIKQQFAKK